ncbi:MAG: hypothetical protein HDS84_03705 [Bacteroidales bacterium]|nr:hypothetical protein [Bacteroidales bacterium]
MPCLIVESGVKCRCLLRRGAPRPYTRPVIDVSTCADYSALLSEFTLLCYLSSLCVHATVL